MSRFDHLTGRDLEVYHEKLRVLHKGPCSGLRLRPEECTCPNLCPLHGRCCDCIAHHKDHLLQDGCDLPSLGWAPTCVQLLIRSRQSEVDK